MVFSCGMDFGRNYWLRAKRSTAFAGQESWGLRMPTKPTIIELDLEELEDFLRRVEAQELRGDDYETIRTLGAAYLHLLELLQDKNTSLARLRKMLFGVQTEKTAAVLGKPEAKASPTAAAQTASSAEIPAASDRQAASPGHGRHGAEAYPGGERIEVRHPSLQPGDACPECGTGTVYETKRPGVLVRFTGQAPVTATIYSLQRLRCNLCGEVFTAPAPADAPPSKYDATAGSMIALLKYGSGMPFNRLEGLQGNLEIPLPASTQWDIVRARAEHAEPVFAELIRQAAQGDVVYNDDTTARILELMGKHAPTAVFAAETVADSAEESGKKPPKRTGVFTSGIVSTREGRKIALFFSGWKHAGENLADVLAKRAQELSAPIQMCDALARNLPRELQTIVAHCLAHARRQFVEVVDRFPEECRHVLESLAVVYRNDAIAREKKLSPAARRHFHQSESGPVMEELHAWLKRQFDERRVEPNSSLGGAISYLLKHWDRLTLFLRVPGAPLDNNICERALKLAIRHRKNALFYKTRRGAQVGDLFMSLIHTCELGGVNPFDYLTELERHVEELSAAPQNWMPWNYRETVADAVPAQ
jgi:transposase